MSAKTKAQRAEAQLAFDALTIEGGLVSPEWLAKVAQLAASHQSEADYRIPKGLQLRDEIGRYWRIAQAHWAELVTGIERGADGRALAERFATGILRESFGFASLAQAEPVVIAERSYPIGWGALEGRVPVVIATAASGLDALSPDFGDGGRRRSAFGLAQEYLNAQDGSLWGLATDGHTLRILRDNASLTRPAWIEADLARIFTEELYADFAALWLLAHETRFGRPEQPVTECALEAWREAGREEGTRARDKLRGGVEEALAIFGQGFLAHPDNTALRSALASGELTTTAYFQELLRLVYRLIFLLTVEERGLLHPEDAESNGLRNRGSTEGGGADLPLPLPEGGRADHPLPLAGGGRGVGGLVEGGRANQSLPLAGGGRGVGGDQPGESGRADHPLPLAGGGRGVGGPPARALYAAGYSIKRLRERSAKRSAHDRYADLWEATKIVFRGLDEGEPRLALPALKGLFAKNQCPTLDASKLQNSALLLAMFRLSWLREPTGLARVNWRDMGPEELGSVYESLLELVPQIQEGGRKFTFLTGGETKGNARKTSGSYYTPDSLVQVLLDSALEPVVESTIAANPKDPARALLELAVVDPACGSGHFLLAAARRLAAHVARLTADGTPSAAEYRHALRQVVAKCIYGVDLNPMAVELCKVSLWMEAVEPGLPLTFLDSHIRQGNALLGTTPELMAKGIPDDAWKPIEGDDKKIASALKKRNKSEAKGQRSLDLFESKGEDETSEIARALAALDQASDAEPALLAKKEKEWARIQASAAYQHQRLVADAWCAAFVWPKQPGPLADAAPTNAVWRQLRDGKGTPNLLTVKTTEELRDQYNLFHWHLAFPQIFERGGFDIVLGNPPWERVKLQEKEFFAARSAEIANAPNAAARKKLIAKLPQEDPALWEAWCAASREAEGQSHFIRQSGRYPLCGKGDVNTYALFAEHNRAVLGPAGRAGFIVPAGIATDDTTKEYFQSLVASANLASVYHFENEEKIFPGVHNAFRFVLITLDGSGQSKRAQLLFFARQVSALDDPARHFSLAPPDFATLNPNTRTCPTFRSRRDAEINLALYQRAGVLWRDDGPEGGTWGMRFMTMFHMASDSGLFRTASELDAMGCVLDENRYSGSNGTFLPLLEAKLVHQYDHRFATFANATQANLNKGTLPRLDDSDHANPHQVFLPEYWVHNEGVESQLAPTWTHGWLLGWRDITGTEKERTVIASLFPRVGVGHTTPLLFPQADPQLACGLYASLCSFILDYTARQKVGGTHLTYSYLKQLPVLAPSTYEQEAAWAPGTLLRDWILPRVLELTYTAWDLEPFAHDVGYEGPPFRWDPERRFLLRAELDAAFFHLYGISREDADYILDTFPIVRKNDEKAHGEYRTKRVILEIYDELAHATQTGLPYQTRLTPPPADPRVAHPPREVSK